MRSHVTAVLVVCLAVGCAARAKYSSSAVSMSAIGPAQGPPPLDKSVFSKDPEGHLTEDQIQQILDAPLDADFPGRVGVLPIVTAKDWRGPNPSYNQVPVGVGAFVSKLRGADDFTMVTEVMPIPSGALGMEALREVAARYRLRYVLLYREQIVEWTRANAWAWGYATLAGALFLPGQTLHADGFLEASLFDVKTGVFLFTVRRRVSGESTANVWHNDDKLAAMQAQLAVRFSPELATQVKSATMHYQESVKIENARKLAKYQEQQQQQPAQPQQPTADVTNAAATN
jgi:hypothetical protein